MKTVKDGWCKVYGEDIYVEDGKVVRWTTGEGAGYRTTYPYEYDKENGGWNNISRHVTLSAFRAGFKRGTKMMK